MFGCEVCVCEVSGMCQVSTGLKLGRVTLNFIICQHFHSYSPQARVSEVSIARRAERANESGGVRRFNRCGRLDNRHSESADRLLAFHRQRI